MLEENRTIIIAYKGLIVFDHNYSIFLPPYRSSDENTTSAFHNLTLKIGFIINTDDNLAITVGCNCRDISTAVFQW